MKPAGEEAVSVSFALPEDLRDVFSALPGQHIVLRANIEGTEVRRTYSLVNMTGAQVLEIGVRVHDQGVMSRYIARSLKVGDVLDVLPPNGSFHTSLDSRAQHRYVGFASGCGITPVLSLVKSVLAEEPDSQFTVFFGNRTVSRTMFLDEILGLKDKYIDRVALHFVMSREPQDSELFNGWIDADKVRFFADELFFPEITDAFFLCGPGTMMEDVGKGLSSLGVNPGRVHVEHFTVDTVGDGERPRAEVRQAAGATEVTVILDGRRRTFTIAEKGDTVLAAAAAAGIDLPYSCCAGVCSTCRTKVVSGQVVMEENYALEQWEVEEGYVLACQSRPVTDELLLDYDDV